MSINKKKWLKWSNVFFLLVWDKISYFAYSIIFDTNYRWVAAWELWKQPQLSHLWKINKFCKTWQLKLKRNINKHNEKYRTDPAETAFCLSLILLVSFLWTFSHCKLSVFLFDHFIPPVSLFSMCLNIGWYLKGQSTQNTNIHIYPLWCCLSVWRYCLPSLLYNGAQLVVLRAPKKIKK